MTNNEGSLGKFNGDFFLSMIKSRTLQLPSAEFYIQSPTYDDHEEEIFNQIFDDNLHKVMNEYKQQYQTGDGGSSDHLR